MTADICRRFVPTTAFLVQNVVAVLSQTPQLLFPDPGLPYLASEVYQSQKHPLLTVVALLGVP